MNDQQQRQRSRAPKTTESEKDPLRVLRIEQYPGESADTALARAKLSPTTQGAMTVVNFGSTLAQSFAATDTNAVVAELRKHVKAANENDLSRLEEMLTVQAHSLDAIFNDCARRARLNIGEYPEAFERYMKVALRAQSQCRSAIEALAEIKNPKPFFAVAQANVANGPQQVNNGASAPLRAPASTRAEENQNPPNELLEKIHEPRLVPSSASTTGATDTSLAPLVEIDGAEVRRRDEALQSQCAKARRVL